MLLLSTTKFHRGGSHFAAPNFDACDHLLIIFVPQQEMLPRTEVFGSGLVCTKDVQTNLSIPCEHPHLSISVG